MKNIKNFNNKHLIVVVIIGIALFGVLVTRFMKAETLDGYQRIRILNAATSEIGQKEWSPRVLSYSENNKENWCADFVSWVYMKAGYPFNAGASNGRSSWRIPLVYLKVNGVPNLRDYAISKNAYQTKESGYIPAVGDIVLFTRNGRSHTGIVERYEVPSKNSPGGLYTIEGNTSTQDVARRSYNINDATIDGYSNIIDKVQATPPSVPPPTPPPSK